MKELSPLDVVLAGVEVGFSTDPRRCIVIRVHADKIELIPCSAQPELYRSSRDFWISDDDAERRRFGFTKPSHAIDLPPILLPKREVKRHYGRLDGEVAERFQTWFGEKLV